MAGFGRSNSLSINTGGGGGGGSLFGNNANSNQPATQPQSSGGLFGAPQQQQPQQQPQSASLFGTQPSQPQSGSLFGGNSQQNQAPAQSRGLFAPSTQQTTTPSLFGNAKPTPSLFTSTQQSQPQQQQQQTSLFGGMNSQNRPAPLGGSTLGGSQLGASAQPVQMTADSMKGTTRFNDLHPDLQNVIQLLDEGIRRKVSYCNQIRETLPQSQNDIATIAPDVAYVEAFLSTVETGLDNDSTSIAHLKDVVKKDAADATLSFRAIENQRLPAQFHYRNSTNLTASSAKAPTSTSLEDDDPTKPVDLMAYFGRRIDDLGSTLDVYQHQIREIEAHLRTMEAGTLEKAQQLTGSRSAPRDQRHELVEALKAIEGAILESAKKVGKVRDEVTQQTLGNVAAALL